MGIKKQSSLKNWIAQTVGSWFELCKPQYIAYSPVVTHIIRQSYAFAQDIVYHKLYFVNILFQKIFDFSDLNRVFEDFLHDIFHI